MKRPEMPGLKEGWRRLVMRHRSVDARERTPDAPETAEEVKRFAFDAGVEGPVGEGSCIISKKGTPPAGMSDDMLSCIDKDENIRRFRAAATLLLFGGPVLPVVPVCFSAADIMKSAFKTIL